METPELRKSPFHVPSCALVLRTFPSALGLSKEAAGAAATSSHRENWEENEMGRKITAHLADMIKTIRHQLVQI